MLKFFITIFVIRWFYYISEVLNEQIVVWRDYCLGSDSG
jgi:limonene-1,2-epoxide hydrolase